jgi:DNA-binding Lrp family transcriptional regulator
MGSDVTRSVAQIDGVNSAEAVTGPYDVIAYAEARNLDSLSKIVVGQVQQIEGVSRTLTCPIVHF